MKFPILAFLATTGMVALNVAGGAEKAWSHFINSARLPVGGRRQVIPDFSQNILNLIIGKIDAGGRAEFHAPPKGPDWLSTADNAG